MKLDFSSFAISLLLTVSLSQYITAEKEKKPNVLSSYGELCDRTDCDSSLGLVCDSKSYKCSCSKPSDMIFDSNVGKCVLLVNASCGKTGEINLSVATSSCTADAECITQSRENVKSTFNISTGNTKQNSDDQQQSSLSQTGVCKCVEGLKADKNRQCTIEVDMNDPPSCTGNGNGQCGAGMTCIGNSCVCIDQQDMVYDEESRSCKSLVDTACFIVPVAGVEKNCVANADCVSENNLVGYCKCRPEYDPDENKMCVGRGNSSTTPTTTDRTTTTLIITTTEESETTTSETVTPTRTTTANPGLGLIGEPCVNDEQTSSTTDKSNQNDNAADGGVGSFVIAKNNNKCILNAKCVMGKCACEKDYVAENAKLCVPASGLQLTASVLLVVICHQIATYFT